LVVGDNHGFHHNLRKLLVQEGVIDKKGHAINRDEYKVYCTGDLIDGEINRAGDILNLQYMEEWFDAVCIGNHEYAFLGGRDFGTKRKHDRETVRLLLQRLDEGLLVPSIVVEGHLLTHAGLSKEFDFKTPEDANEFIHAMWDAAPYTDETIAILDWKNNTDTFYSSSDPTSGIFNLAWKKDRNPNFGQIVGHTIFTNGPIMQKQEDSEILHFNIDVGAKEGKAQGGIVIEKGMETRSIFWGERKYDNSKVAQEKFPLVGDYIGEYNQSVANRYGTPKREYGSESFLGQSTGKVDFIDPTAIKVGDKLLSTWGETFRVSQIHRGEGNVTLKSLSEKDKVINRPLNSNWMISFRKIQTINLIDSEDRVKLLGSSIDPILSDEEIIEHYREELALL
jgi:hypothetical protein